MNSNDGSDYILVNNAECLAQLTESLAGTSRVGLDTEADSLHHYFEKVCLIQLSFSGKNYIIDPLAGFSLDAFLGALALKELVLQGADYDLRMLKRSYEFRPRAPVFDTMLAAQVLGYEKIGLAALVERSCGGCFQRRDKRPIGRGVHSLKNCSITLRTIRNTWRPSRTSCPPISGDWAGWIGTGNAASAS